MSRLAPVLVAYTVMSPEATIAMDTAFPGTFDEATSALRAAGYDGVEFQVESPFDFATADIKAQLAKQSLGVSSLATGPMRQRRGLSLSSLDTETRAQTVLESKHLIEHASELGTGVSFGRIMEPDVVVDPPRHYDLLADSLRELSLHADRVGARVLIEPQNPAIVTLVTEHGAAEAFLTDRDLAGIGLIFDTYHVVKSGRDSVDQLAATSAAPALVQVAETVSRGAVEYPDEPLQAFLDVLLSRGYDGWITMEHLQTAGTETPARSLSELGHMLALTKERSS